jgi:TetR/AcrR family transcriptional regulator, transcriptional repressor for nem operon
MTGRPRKFDEKEVIRKASAIFWKKGYESSSADELLEAMNMGKGSFYLHFKDGKLELYRRSLELFSEEAMERFDKELQNAEDRVGFLKKFISSLADSPAERKEKGCYLGNCVVEMSGIEPALKDQAGALLARLEKAFYVIICQAQEKGQLKTKTAPEILAKYLINLRNGINVTARTEKNTRQLKEMIGLSLEILK